MEFSPSYDEDIRPDLLITVNFTMLNISSASILDGAVNSVQVMLGLSNNTDNVLQTTSPTMLLPGMNVLGMSRLTIRQKFGKATVAALGVEASTLFFSTREKLTENINLFFTSRTKHSWSRKLWISRLILKHLYRSLFLDPPR
jgi:hypothetical protein